MSRAWTASRCCGRAAASTSGSRSCSRCWTCSASSVPPDLVEGQGEVVGEPVRGHDQPSHAVVVGEEPVAQGPGGQPAQQVVQLVQGLDGGRGVVDAGRERLLGDVDELAEPEGDVLLHAAVAAEVHRGLDPGQVQPLQPVAVRIVHVEQRCALGHEVAEVQARPEQDPRLGGRVDQRPLVQADHHPEARTGHDAGHRPERGRHRLAGGLLPAGREAPVDRRAGLVPDRADD